MPRTLRTLLLSATALVAVATVAAATPATSPPDDDAMAGMHAMIMGDPATHESMHAMMMAEPATDESMHADAAMQADCPMLTDDSMASMPRRGGHDPSGHHRTTGGDRS